MKITESVTIQAPIETVFDVFTDLELVQHRIKGIKQIEILNGPAQMTVGTKWRETREFYGKEATEEMWVSELNKNTSYVVEADSRGTKYTSIYTFETKQEGVLVTLEFIGKPHTLGAKLMSVIGVLFNGTFAKALRQDLQDLKLAAESQA